MVSNSEIHRLFDLYAELSLLHEKDKRLAGLLSGATYRLRNMSTEVMERGTKEFAKIFCPDVVRVLRKFKISSTIKIWTN